MEKEIKWKDIEHFLRNAPNPVLLEISTSDCRHCQELTNSLDNKELPGGIIHALVKLDLGNEDDIEIAEQLGVFSVPTVIGFCHASEIDRVHGKTDLEPLLTKLKMCRGPE